MTIVIGDIGDIGGIGGESSYSNYSKILRHQIKKKKLIFKIYLNS